MTERTINSALKKIKEARDVRHNIEAFFLYYQLNARLMRYILSALQHEKVAGDKKLRVVIKLLQSSIEKDPANSSVIQKRSVKAMKLWVTKCEAHIKALKNGISPPLTGALQESEKIYGILKITVNKLKVKEEKTI